MQLEFVGQSAQDPDNVQAGTSRLINCYREPAESGMVIKSVLGMTTFTTLDGVFLRAMARIEDVLYVVHGGFLWSISANGSKLNLGAVAESVETTISGNNGNVTIVAGGKYYVWDGTTLTEPETGAFDAFGSVTFFAQLTVLTELNGRRVQWSSVADPSTLDGLDFATTESRDDNNLRVQPLGGELWFFKTRSIERWYSPPGGGLTAIPGGTIEIGLKAYGLLAPIQNGVFFVGDDNRAYVATPGAAPSAVSTASVETSITSQAPQQAFYYEDEARKICVITFLDRPAWCYDLSTGEWHERAEDQGPWSAVASANAYGSYFVGTTLGSITKLERTNMDLGGPMIRTMTSRTLTLEGNRFRIARLQFQARTGRRSSQAAAGERLVTLTDGDGNIVTDEDGNAIVIQTTGGAQTPPTVLMEISGDRGETWGAPKARSMGTLGAYDTQIVYRALGQFRNCTVRLTCSEAIDAPFEAVAFVDLA